MMFNFEHLTLKTRFTIVHNVAYRKLKSKAFRTFFKFIFYI